MIVPKTSNCIHSLILMRSLLSLYQGDARLGHPKVYINLDKPEINVCGYCGKRFVSETHKNRFPEEKFCSLDS